MHEGFVNFNAGTLGAAMIEGRVSAGVVIGADSDLGAAAAPWAHYPAVEQKSSLSVKIA